MEDSFDNGSVVTLDGDDEESEKMFEDYDEQFCFEKKQKRFQQMTFLLGCLKNHFIFYNLSNTELENVAKKMYYCYVSPDSYIFKEGSKSLWFFIIEKGMMHVIMEGKVKKQLRVGDGFGEIALLYKTQRTFSVKACQGCCLWAIDRNTFRKAVEEIILKQYEQNKAFMENIRFFRSLSNDHKDAIAGSVIVQNFSKGQTIINEGDPGSSFYIVKKGEASVWKGAKFVTKLTRTDTFGQQSLFYNTVRQMSVKAECDLTCLILSRETLAKVLGDQIFIVTFRNFIKWAFEKSAFISKLRKEEHEKIIDLMKINTYKAGNVIIKKSQDNSLPANRKIIVIIEGAIKKSKSMYPFAVRSQVYGEEFLLETKSKARYDDDIIMESNGVLAEIKADLVKDIIGGELDVVISERERIVEQEIKTALEKREKPFISELSDLVVLKQLKQGEFGFSFIVGCPKQADKKLYFLRCDQKTKIQAQTLAKYKQQQIDLFRKLKHPFIIQGYKSLEDLHFLYTLVEFVKGQELYEVIREIGLLSTEDAQFYTACIILIMQYLSEQGIYLRDIKPENFIVDMEGFPILADLVSAKVQKDNNIKNKTFTVIGTPHYMAPEIIMSKGYNFYSSLYSLGINLFEFMCGFVPFGEKNEDPMEIYEDILNSQIKFPKSLKDNKARKLIEQLLDKFQPESRLGGPNFQSLKNNPWFQKIDWKALHDKKCSTPEFNNNPNIEESEVELQRFMVHAKNCLEVLSAKYPNYDLKKSISDSSYSQW